MRLNGPRRDRKRLFIEGGGVVSSGDFTVRPRRYAVSLCEYALASVEWYVQNIVQYHVYWLPIVLYRRDKSSEFWCQLSNLNVESYTLFASRLFNVKSLICRILLYETRWGGGVAELKRRESRSQVGSEANSNNVFSEPLSRYQINRGIRWNENTYTLTFTDTTSPTTAHLKLKRYPGFKKNWTSYKNIPRDG